MDPTIYVFRKLKLNQKFPYSSEFAILRIMEGFKFIKGAFIKNDLSRRPELHIMDKNLNYETPIALIDLVGLELEMLVALPSPLPLDKLTSQDLPFYSFVPIQIDKLIDRETYLVEFPETGLKQYFKWNSWKKQLDANTPIEYNDLFEYEFKVLLPFYSLTELKDANSFRNAK